MQSKEPDLFEIIYPSHEVPFEIQIKNPDGSAGTKLVMAKIYPMGGQHLHSFAGEIATTLGILGKLDIKTVRDGEVAGKAIMAQMIPYVITNMLSMFETCIEFNVPGVSLKKLPHWFYPQFIEEWLILSFGSEDKWRPWVATIENLVFQTTGTRISILETLSSSSSPTATP